MFQFLYMESLVEQIEIQLKNNKNFNDFRANKCSRMVENTERKRNMPENPIFSSENLRNSQ